MKDYRLQWNFFRWSSLRYLWQSNRDVFFNKFVLAARFWKYIKIKEIYINAGTVAWSVTVAFITQQSWWFSFSVLLQIFFYSHCCSSLTCKLRSGEHRGDIMRSFRLLPFCVSLAAASDLSINLQIHTLQWTTQASEVELSAICFEAQPHVWVLKLKKIRRSFHFFHSLIHSKISEQNSADLLCLASGSGDLTCKCKKTWKYNSCLTLWYTCSLKEMNDRKLYLNSHLR